MLHIVEQNVVSKSGIPDACEDAIVATEDFAAVIDGVTAKTTSIREGITPGRLAAQLIAESVRSLPATVSAHQAVNVITRAIKDYYEQAGILPLATENPWERLTAAIVLCSRAKRQIWMVGDCQAMFGGRVFRNEKPVDRILAETRSVVLELALIEGRRLEDLRDEEEDIGRKFILPLLTRQQLLQNTPVDSQYRYGVIDGFPVARKCVRIVRIGRKIRHVVLASDGYPELCSTLEESEAILNEILMDDPLCFRRFKSTKGVLNGDVSFDDRAYVKIDLGPTAS